MEVRDFWLDSREMLKWRMYIVHRSYRQERIVLKGHQTFLLLLLFFFYLFAHTAWDLQHT